MVDEIVSEKTIQDLWRKIADEYLKVEVEEVNELWNIIYNNFKSGGDDAVKNYIRERFASLERQILTAIESVKGSCPEG